MTTEQGGAPSASAGGAPAPADQLAATLAPIFNLARLINDGLAKAAQQMRQEPDLVAQSEPTGPVAPTERELRRLRYVARIHLDLAIDQAKFWTTERMVTELRNRWRTAEQKNEAARAEAQQLVAQRDEHARSIRELIAERDRLRRRREDEADERLALYGGLINRMREALREDARVQTANIGAVRSELDRLVDVLEVEVAQHDQTKAERDHLRQELALIGEQRPKFQPEQRVRVGNGECFGTVHTTLERYTVEIDDVHFLVDLPPAFLTALPDDKPAEPNRQGCPCKSQCDYLDGEGRCSDSCNCAAGRRWVAGDPEPEIGVTVRRGSAWYVRRQNGWHDPHECPADCGKQSGTWAWLTGLGGELVEVVATDG